MTIKVTMPQMGESVYEGTLTKWLKKVGDSVQRDEPLFEISTDKVDSEIPSPATGILTEILVPEGETIKINTTLAIIGEESKNSGSQPEESTRDTKPLKVSSVEEAKKEEAIRAEDKPDKNDTAETDVIHEVRINAMPEAPRIPDSNKREIEETGKGIQLRSIRTSPLVRKIARENNVDLSEVQGTGLEGRITRDDILKYIEKLSLSRSAATIHTGYSQPSISTVPEEMNKKKPSALSESLQRFVGETETVPLSPMRKAIAEHMVLSKHTSPHVNTVFEVDLQNIVKLRERYKEDFEKREGVRLTYTPFFAKALVDTVREWPIFNASLSGDEIVYKKPVNLGIAVALDQGLIVPVIKNAQLKSLTGIALKIDDLANRARTKKLKPEEVQDGTISMTNPGRYGALFATPIINQPQVAILGVGGVEKRPIVINDAIAIRPMVCLSLSFDHRVIDGAIADQFMVALKKKLESWTQWSE